MPLAQRSDDPSESRYCGVEAAYNPDVAHTLHSSLDAGFDFVVAPLVSAPPPVSCGRLPWPSPPAATECHIVLGPPTFWQAVWQHCL